MRRVLIVLALLVAIVALPSASRAAAPRCASSAPMDCCAGMGEDGAPPCHCSLNPVPPAPETVGSAAVPAVVLAEAPLPAVTVETPAPAEAPAPVAPRARSAPLHILYSVFLI
jgi:hypothetical protein